MPKGVERSAAGAGDAGEAGAATEPADSAARVATQPAADAVEGAPEPAETRARAATQPADALVSVATAPADSEERAAVRAATAVAAAADDAEVADEHASGFGLERIVFFSDAVFAIAITLLAIDIRLPALPSGVSDAEIRRALADLAPEVFAFALSFVVIAQLWIGHYRTFRYVRRADLRLVYLNFAFLFCIALLPFPTSVLAHETERQTGAVFYSAFVVVTGLLATLLWAYPARVPGLHSSRITDDLARRIGYRSAVIPVVFGLSIPVALVSPLSAAIVWVAAVPIQVIVTRRLGLGRTIGMSIGGAEATPGRDRG